LRFGGSRDVRNAGFGPPLPVTVNPGLTVGCYFFWAASPKRVEMVLVSVLFVRRSDLQACHNVF
jgi:hypothetical protein